MDKEKKRLVVGVSGASGAPIAVELLKALREYEGWQTHVVITKGAEQTILQETKYSIDQFKMLCDNVYNPSDIGAAIASGTFKTEGMVVVPCSMKTVSGISTGYSENLLLRAADVTLKEGRKLILVARETPFNRVHLKNLLTLSEMGVVILPPMLTYYTNPETVEEMTSHIVGKILDRIGLEPKKFRRWKSDR